MAAILKDSMQARIVGGKERTVEMTKAQGTKAAGVAAKTAEVTIQKYPKALIYL
jgi:hypothetical protein